MKRLPLTFECQGKTLAGTFDMAPGTTGLLIVNGGNEIRSGAFAGQAHLARQVAKAGFPVFRFDRRGIGDSEGENRGFRKQRRDIIAAHDSFRAIAPHVTRVVGMGNCDAASALMLASGAGCDGLILCNPWTIEGEAGDQAIPPAPAVRLRYLQKLRKPSEVFRLLTGRVDLRKLARGLRQAAWPVRGASSLAGEMKQGLESFDGKVKILLAEADRTAQEFVQNWGPDARVETCAGAGHSFVEGDARDWLLQQVLRNMRS